MYFFHFFFYFLKRLLVVFWLVKTYQYGCHPFVLSHHDAHVGSGRRNVMNHIWSFFRRGCGDLFYHESYCDEGVIMTIYGFLNIQMFCDVSSGVGLCPYMGNWCVYTLIWFPPSLLVFLGWIKCPNIYY